MYTYASFYLTWLRRSRVLEIAVIDVHLNHYFPSLSAVLRFGHIYKEAMCAWVCAEFLNFWIHYYQWLFNRKIQRWLVQSQGGNFRNVQQPANEGVNRTRVATLAFPSYMQELKKMLLDTVLYSKRFHTCIFNQDYISQRSVTAHKCSRPVLLEMYQLSVSDLNEFFFVQISTWWSTRWCFS